MRKIKSELIKKKIESMVIRANTQLRPDVLAALKKAKAKEKNKLLHNMFSAIIENAGVARNKKLAICQDTGLPVVFLEIGDKVCVDKNIEDIINQATASAYKKGYFRASIQKDPLLRAKRPSYEPVIIHTNIVNGTRLKITLLVKGFGCENKASVKMFNPTTNLADIENFIVEVVRWAGASACPPYVIGVGIGGTQDFAGLLAKKALLRSITKPNNNKKLASLEKRLINRINALKIGPMGLGGNSTVLGVNIKTYPTHIAGLPVAVNISCHALRSASVVI